MITRHDDDSRFTQERDKGQWKSPTSPLHCGDHHCPNNAEEMATYCTQCRAKLGQSYWVKYYYGGIRQTWAEIKRSFDPMLNEERT